MRFQLFCLGLLASIVRPSIIENGRPREETYPETKIAPVAAEAWTTFPPNATELSYKGRITFTRLTSFKGGRKLRYSGTGTSISHSHNITNSAPGLKFGFTGDKVAIKFGQHTSPGVLVGYRLDGQDWLFSNVTANSTHQFITDQSRGFNLSTSAFRSFELRVTNWAYGVQISAVYLAPNANLVKIPNFAHTIEIIGDSLSAGQYNSYEAMSSWSWSLAAGLGDTEFSISAYPGICLTDRDCWGNPRGQEFQWFYTQDTSSRAQELYDRTPEKWDFARRPSADLVLINIGTNDQNAKFEVSPTRFRLAYERFVERIHKLWPDAQIIIMSLTNGHSEVGSYWAQNSFFKDEIVAVYNKYKSGEFIHYFNTTGIMNHNDIGPGWHPTDVGQIKLASHLMQYIAMKFNWRFHGTGSEVESGTVYWNNQPNY